MIVTMNKNPLFIPENKRWRGLGVTVFCRSCQKNRTDICGKTNGPLKKCPYGATHTFKCYIQEPGSDTGRRTKTFSTRDPQEALRLAMKFREEVKSGRKQHPVLNDKIENNQKESGNPYLLRNAMSRYLDYLSGVNVPEFKKRVRSEKHRKEVMRILEDFSVCSKKNSDNVKERTIDQVDENLIGKFHEDIVKSGYSNRSYNKMMGVLKSFYNYLIREHYTRINPVLGVVRRPENRDVAILTKEEYSRLEEAIQKPELGFCKLGSDEVKNYFKPWMLDAVQLGIFTGRRTEEIVMLRWQDVVLDENGNLSFLEATDFKVSRQQGRLEDNPKKIPVPVTKELRKLLLRLGYKKYKNTDRFILAGDEKMKRDTIKLFISKSFTNYWNQLNIPKKATFKSLRRTYISKLSAAIGINNAQVITKHAGQEVMTNHYVSSQILASTAKNFRVWGEDGETRNDKLEKIRMTNHIKENTRER